MKSQQRCIHTLPHRAHGLTFSPDGKILFSRNYQDKTFKVWDVQTGELKQTFTDLNTIALNFDRNILASSKDNIIKLWNLETGELENSLTDNLSSINRLIFSPDGKTLLIEDSKTIKLWDIEAGQLKGIIADNLILCSTVVLYVPNSQAIVFSPDGKTLAISLRGSRQDKSSQNISLWDVETCQLLRTLDKNSGSLAFSHDGKTLFISFRVERYESLSYNYTRLWDIKTGEIIKTLSSNYFGALSPDGKIMVGIQSEYHHSMAHYKNINVIDLATEQTIGSFPGTDASLSPDGHILAISENEESLKLLELSTLKPIATLPGPITTFTFSPDGSILAVANYDSIKLWENSTEPIVQQQLHGDAYPHLKELESLLAAELWEDAEREMIDVVERFPDQDLKVIDQLWVHYSKGHYGFSVQKQIWEEVKCMEEKKRMTKNCNPLNNIDQFEYMVGWGKVDFYSNYDGPNDEYFEEAWNKRYKGYYPREFYKEKKLLRKMPELLEEILDQPLTEFIKKADHSASQVSVSLNPPPALTPVETQPVSTSESITATPQLPTLTPVETQPVSTSESVTATPQLPALTPVETQPQKSESESVTPTPQRPALTPVETQPQKSESVTATPQRPALTPVETQPVSTSESITATPQRPALTPVETQPQKSESVTATPQLKKLVLCLNPVADALINSYSPDRNFSIEVKKLSAGAWTHSGTRSITRSLLKFNILPEPSDYQLLCARLFLFADTTTPLYGQGIYNREKVGHSQLSGSNEWLLFPVLSPWTEADVNWHNQPQTMSISKLMPASLSHSQNYEDIDITDLVRSCLEQKINHGFLMELRTEIHYREVTFHGRSTEQPDLQPRLELHYIQSLAG